MGNGYAAPRGEGLEPLRRELRTSRRRQNEVERPTGTSLKSLVAQVRAALENLAAQVNTVATQWMIDHSYTKAQIDGKIASPGTIAPADVNASGRGTFPVGVTSAGAYNELLSGSGGTIRALWIHPDGRFGYLPSDGELKTHPEPAVFTAEQVLKLRAVFYEYWAQVPYSQEIQPTYLGAIAREVEDAGFPWLVDHDDDGKPVGVNHAAGWLVVLEGLRDEHAGNVARDKRIARIEQTLGLDPGD